jgi:CBS domain-containing protein
MPHRLVRSVIAKQKPFVAPGGTSVADAARMMRKHAVGAVMVVDKGRLAGIFTERDALFRVLAESRDPAKTAIADVMTAKPQTIDPNKAVGHALLMMYEGGFRHVPVVERGKPVGMISARDALGPELQEFEAELLQREHIREIIG